jgi:hypothetical protein
MFAHFWPQPDAVKRRSALWRYRLAAIPAAVALLTQGCAPIPPRPFVGAEASDPDIRVPPVAYRPALGSYSSQRPVEPAPWREHDDRAAPTQKKDGP